MSPKPVDKSQKRLEIAMAAFDLFAEQGFSHTSIDDVARAANVAKGTIYNYFDTKEEIVFTIMDTVMEAKYQGFLKRIANASSVKEKIHAFFQFDGDEGLLAKMLKLFHNFFGTLLINPSPQMIERHCRVEEQHTLILEALIEEGIADGEFRPTDVQTLIHQMNLVHKGILFQSRFSGDGPKEIQQKITRHIEFTLTCIAKES